MEEEEEGGHSASGMEASSGVGRGRGLEFGAGWAGAGVRVACWPPGVCTRRRAFAHDG